MTINLQSFLVSNMCGEFMFCGHCERVQTTYSSDIRAVCGEEISVMFTEGDALRVCAV